jgi:hypothetical protein
MEKGTRNSFSGSVGEKHLSISVSVKWKQTQPAIASNSPYRWLF